MGLPHLDTKRGYCRTYRTAHSVYSNTLGIHREEKPGLASVNPLCLFKLPQSRKPNDTTTLAIRVHYTFEPRETKGKQGLTERGRRCGFWSGYRVWWWWWSRSMYGSPIVFPESAVDCEQPSRRALLHQRGRAERAATSHRVGCSPVLIEEAPGWWVVVVGGNDDAHIRGGASMFVGKNLPRRR